MVVFCSGMLRSGSALQYNLVASILEAVGTTVRHGRWEPKGKFTKSQIVDWANDPKVFHVIKSARYPEEFELARQGLARVCYINRDFRDIAVAAKYKWGLEGDKLIEMLDRAQAGHDVMEKMGVLNAPEWCIKQKYENVFHDIEKALIQLMRFLQVDLSDSMIKEIIESCSIEKMEKVTRSKKLIAQERLVNGLGKCANWIKKILPYSNNASWGLRRLYLAIFPKVDKKTCMAPKHIEPTRGMPGAWRDVLSEDEIIMINNRYQSYMVREEYSFTEQNFTEKGRINND